MLSACGVAAQAAGLIERGLCFGDEQPSIVSSAPFCGDSDSTPALIPRRDLLAYRSVPRYARHPGLDRPPAVPRAGERIPRWCLPRPSAEQAIDRRPTALANDGGGACSASVGSVGGCLRYWARWSRAAASDRCRNGRRGAVGLPCRCTLGRVAKETERRRPAAHAPGRTRSAARRGAAIGRSRTIPSSRGCRRIPSGCTKVTTAFWGDLTGARQAAEAELPRPKWPSAESTSCH